MKTYEKPELKTVALDVTDIIQESIIELELKPASVAAGAKAFLTEWLNIDLLSE